jgi:hypothetical protein
MKGLGQIQSAAYTLSSGRTNRPERRIRKEKTMKLTWKQRFRNWLYDDDADKAVEVPMMAIESMSLDSYGMRLQIYKASGGFVVETRRYDERTDRHDNTMHVITEEEDLGERLGKIVMMESLRG